MFLLNMSVIVALSFVSVHAYTFESMSLIWYVLCWSLLQSLYLRGVSGKVYTQFVQVKPLRGMNAMKHHTYFRYLLMPWLDRRSSDSMGASNIAP